MPMAVAPGPFIPANSAEVNLADMGFPYAAWAFDPTATVSGFVCISGSVYGTLVHLYQTIPAPPSPAGMRLYLNAVAAAGALGNAGMALYKLTGPGLGPNLVAQATGLVSGALDMSADFQATGLIIGEIKPAFALTPGGYVVAHWQQGAPASLSRGTNGAQTLTLTSWPNWGFGVSGNQYPRFTNAAGQSTAVAADQVPTTGSGPAIWAGISNA